MGLISRVQHTLLTGVPSFTILSWNMLSTQLAINFPAVSPEYLQWPYRKLLIFEELYRVNADLVLLQELDKYLEVEEELKTKGYAGIFQVKRGWHNDGIAIFYKKRKFQLKKEFLITFEGNQNALGVKLREGDQEFYVFTTHLKSLKKFDNERTGQVRKLVEFFKGLEKLPIVIGGDFNSEPGSCAYNEVYNNELGFKSVYYFGKEVEYTTVKYREDFEVKTEDYLFQCGFDVLGYLGIPSMETIGTSGLPSWNYPSDHFALAANLRFSKLSSQT